MALHGEMEAMRHELEALRSENRSLRMQTGEGISMSDEENNLDEFLSLLKQMLEVRAAGQFQQQLFDAYNASMVRLSEEHLRDMYSCFMLVYIDEADGETLERLGMSDERGDAEIGFAEMMTIKLGELLDQPRHVRVQAYEAQMRKKEELEKERRAQAVRDKEASLAASAQGAANAAVYRSLHWVCAASSHVCPGTHHGSLRPNFLSIRCVWQAFRGGGNRLSRLCVS